MVRTRQGFEDYMTLFYNFVLYTNTDIPKMIESALTNDEALGDPFRLSILRKNALIQGYLTAWDAAPTDPDKEAVEAGVIFDLGSASFDPYDALKWPQSGGVFGDVKAPTNAPVVYGKDVDGKNVGNTLLFTTASTGYFVPTGVRVVLKAVSGLALVSTLSVGTNSPNYNDINLATLLTGLNTASEILNISLISSLNAIPANTDVYCRVSIGSTATTYDLNVSVLGYYI